MLKTVLISFVVLAHSWYDPTCCGGDDCRPVPATELIEIEEGKWKHLPTGAIFKKVQVHPSKDGRFHVCIGNKNHDRGRPYCVYIVQGV